MMKQDGELRGEWHGLDEEVCWQAVAERDARFVGIFVYAVRSTGIYCRPACPARRPRREQVSFFASCAAAEAGGFRACLRCEPRAGVKRDSQIELTHAVCKLIEATDEGSGVAFTLDELGARLGVSPYHLQRTFKRVAGVTPRGYAAAHRLKGFKLNIKEGAEVTGAMYDAGYGSSSRLYERAAEQLGMTPATYRRRGVGMNIAYTIVECRLNRLLVAATERGVCAVTLGANDEELTAALGAEYPAAESIRRDDIHLRDTVDALLRHLAGTEPHLALPLDVQATAFQARVWEELRRIPYGATRSYGEVAAAIGQPTATRAVARACATNPVALVTPCHRVVRESGAAGGYRWGLERKKLLLEQEGAAVAAAARDGS